MMEALSAMSDSFSCAWSYRTLMSPDRHFTLKLDRDLRQDTETACERLLVRIYLRLRRP